MDSELGKLGKMENMVILYMIYSIFYTPSPTKMIEIKDCKAPKTAKEVRSFCGSLQFYNQMITNLNIMLNPLHQGAAKKSFELTLEMLI